MNSKPWNIIKTEINSLPADQLITKSTNNNSIGSQNPQINNLPPVVMKKDSGQNNINLSIGNQQQNNNNSQITQNSSNINENSSVTTHDLTNSINSNNYNNNSIGLTNNNGMYGMGYGGGYGNYSGYGGYGGGYGGYGGSCGGYGGYGMNNYYGGMGGMGGFGPRPFGGTNSQPDFLDKCFFTIERMNFQLFHLCELARMIQQQSSALAFLYEMLSKFFGFLRVYAKDKSIEIFSELKNSTFQKINNLRNFIKDFLNTNSQTEDSKLRSHIKMLDKMLIFLLISGLIALITQSFSK